MLTYPDYSTLYLVIYFLSSFERDQINDLDYS